jgi:tetratricopeptide (TPR) repeat protein
MGRQDPDALWMGGWAIAILAGERAAGLSAIERALELNPNSALAWNFCGWLQSMLQRPDLAIEALQRAKRLSPLDPQRWMFGGGLAHVHLLAGRYEEAVQWADRALQENTRAMAILRLKAAACGQLGRIEEGRECVRRLRELVPALKSSMVGFSRRNSSLFTSTVSARPDCRRSNRRFFWPRGTGVMGRASEIELGWL